MRVFVAGASGAIGRPLLPKLVAAGHEVTGMTRSEERAETVRQTGARAAVVDVFDADALRAAVEEARAEVVLHELTALPDRMDFRKKDLYEPTNRRAHRGHAEPAWTPRSRPARAASCARASRSPTGTRARA